MLQLQLHEGTRNSYDYNCFMLETPFKNWSNVLDNIDDADLYINEDGEYGKEEESHITILYGLHSEVPFERIKKITDEFDQPAEYSITGIGVFENEEYDVLKLNIESGCLNILNEKARELPYTNDYDTYNPHATLAYLQPGKGKKYTKDFSESKNFSSSKYSYSTVSGKKYRWDY